MVTLIYVFFTMLVPTYLFYLLTFLIVLAEFERWADRLKEYQVDESLKKGTRNSLVSYDSHGVSILHAKS